MLRKIRVQAVHYHLTILFFTFFLAYFLRIYYLRDNAISFAYDQARDAFVVKEILNGDLKILGPAVSGIPGLYHGVLYYYFIAPFYALGQGNPVTVAYALSFFNSLGIFIAYFFTYVLTKKSAPALISALMFAFSFEASQYANLLSNPSMAIWFIPLSYIGLYLFLTRRTNLGAPLTGLFFGLSIQSEIALAYHLLPLAVFVFVYRKFITSKDVFKFLCAFILAIFPMILTEIKFGFKGVQGLIYLFTVQDGVSQNRGILDIFFIYIRQVAEAFANNIFPGNLLIGGLVACLIILTALVQRKRRNILEWRYFLLISIAPQIVALPFGGTNMRHIMAGSTVAICVFVSIFLYKTFDKKPLLYISTILVLLFSNLMHIIKENKDGQTIFPLQKDLILSKELAVINYTYTSSNGAPFDINTITSPLWINTLWSYLYNWQGLASYGYLPGWVGKNQIGQLGNNLQSRNEASLNFLIIEPTYGIPEKFIKETIDDENSKTTILEEVRFGDIIVQKRKYI